jgi:hypothetical protein
MMLGDTHSTQLAIRNQVSLVLSDVLRAQPVGRPLEVLSELLDRAEVNAGGNRRQIPTLEFFQHRSS